MAEVATRRPAHEVIIEAIGANAGAVEKLSSDFFIRTPSLAAAVVTILCGVVQESVFPRDCLAEMTAELKRIKKQSAEYEGNPFSAIPKDAIDGTIRDLEGRQAATQ